MLNKLFSILLLVLAHSISPGQTCLHTDLSKRIEFKTNINKIKGIANFNDSCIVTITIINKSTKKVIQEIIYNSIYFNGNVFTDCSYVKSYSTKKNISREDIDNDFGDLVVADFNFDGKEDFAVKNDSGGNGGPLYSFYIENNDGEFLLDEYLTKTMIFFPTKMSKAKRTLTTLVHANAYEMCRTIYKLSSMTNKWIEVSRSFVKY